MVDLIEGTWTRPCRGPDDDGDYLLTLMPPAHLTGLLCEDGPCEFSAGNSWPDTPGMFDYIEGQLADGFPVTLIFRTRADADACYESLCGLGVRDRPDPAGPEPR